MPQLLRLCMMGILAIAVLAPTPAAAQAEAPAPEPAKAKKAKKDRKAKAAKGEAAAADPAAPASAADPLAPSVPPAAGAPAAPAAPIDMQVQLKAAEKLVKAGSYDEALDLVDQGLVLSSKDLPLLKLRGDILALLGDHAAAVTAYQLYLDSGATGSKRRQVEKALVTLRGILATGVEFTVEGGAAAIYLKSKARGAVCTAAPTCTRAYLAGTHNVIAEAEGYVPWSGKVVIVKGQVAKLAIQLVEKPSQLTVTTQPADATITINGAPYAGPVELPAGPHKLSITRAGHVTETRDLTAKLGAPLTLDVALTALVPIKLSPANATVTLDGKVVAISNGALPVPPGAHALVVTAPEHGERKIDIPASRDPGYKLDVALTSTTTRVAVKTESPSMFTPRRKIALAVGGVSVASLAAGVFLGLSSKSLEDDSFELCPDPSSCAEADEANDLNDRSRSRALQANIAFGVAGAAAVGAVFLWVTGGPSSESRERVSITPRFDSAGLDVGVRF